MKAALAILWLVASGDPTPSFAVAGRVLHATGKNPVYVALWSTDGFLVHPARQLRLEPGTTQDYQYKFDVPPGRWALSAFEDRNGDGLLDMGLFGPKEPSGFWPAFTGWHKPKFDEVSFQVDRDLSGADVVLR